MDAFTHLSVLVSIILGLAITQVLQGFRSLIHNRQSIDHYWPVVVWSILLLLMYAQSWWTIFGLRDRTEWTFAQFAILLTQTIFQYLMAALVLPDMATGQRTDLRRHYYDQRRWFYAAAIAATCASLAKNLVFDGRLPETGNLTVHIIFASTCLIAIVTRANWYHQALSVVTLAGFSSYVIILFSTLH